MDKIYVNFKRLLQYFICIFCIFSVLYNFNSYNNFQQDLVDDCYDEKKEFSLTEKKLIEEKPKCDKTIMTINSMNFVFKTLFNVIIFFLLYIDISINIKKNERTFTTSTDNNLFTHKRKVFVYKRYIFYY